MEGPDRRSPAYLKQTLLKKGYEFSFFQVMRLLRRLDENNIDGGSVSAKPPDIRVVPNLSLSFPASDVEKIESIESEDSIHYRVTANFLGLYGSSSPLPTFYTEDLMDEAADDSSASRDFIDILNQQFYQLLFGGWQKYRQFLQVTEEKNPQCIERLFCLEGFGETTYRKTHPDTYQLLRYIGLFSQFPRSASGLQTLLEDAIQLPIKFIPCIARKVKIPEDQRLHLGISGGILGHNSIIGEKIDDRMGKFRLRIGPLTADDYRGFFPGSDTYNKLVTLTDLYLQDPLDYDLEIYMYEKQAQTTCLGGSQWSKLGMDTWLYAGEEIGETKNIFHPATR